MIPLIYAHLSTCYTIVFLRKWYTKMKAAKNLII